jgi:formylglycine-generating enzyme required for sulfatase activity
MLLRILVAVSLSTLCLVGYGQEKEITNSIGMKLVLIPKGTFQMGSPEGEKRRAKGEVQHEVTLSKEFYLGVTEVTQVQYQKVMGENPSWFQGDNIQCDSSNHPVDYVLWEEAVEFCKRLSELPEEKKAGRVYRLPTEAEWEYGCRAGRQTAFSFGDARVSLGDYAWFVGNSNNRTHPVGQKKPNAWGLYDMHGNVWEWCSDFYGEYPSSAVRDPAGPRVGSEHVLRSGGWNCEAADCRSASRRSFGPSDREFDTEGFRVALSLPDDNK